MLRRLIIAIRGDPVSLLHRLGHNVSRSVPAICLINRTLYADCQRPLRNGKVGRLYSTSIQHPSLRDIAAEIKAGRITNVVIMAGAGISTPSGIPDFRTPGTGLYDNLSKYNLPYAEAIFDLDYFSGDPKPFFTLAKDLYHEGCYRPNIVHHFVRLLSDKDVLQKMYTQNIDGLERAAGIPEDKLVEAHGTFATATCQKCWKKYDGDDIKEAILQSEVPHCQHPSCNGVIKPDIVFFGEQLPGQFYNFVTELPLAQLLVVMGTSLEVHPFAGMASYVSRSVPRILFNKEVAGSFLHEPRPSDVILAGDIVASVEEFCRHLRWSKELHELMKRDTS